MIIQKSISGITYRMEVFEVIQEGQQPQKPNEDMVHAVHTCFAMIHTMYVLKDSFFNKLIRKCNEEISYIISTYLKS